MLGNDIVDLQNLNVHPRFLEKVCTIEEQRVVASSLNPFLALWTHWAAKEATYKAVKKMDSNILFSPKKFVCEENLTYCHYNDFSAKLDVVTTTDYVHVIACFCDNFTSVVRSNNIPESLRVRNIAVDLLNEMGYSNCTIINTPPQVWRGNKILHDIDLSLSHDGRYAAAVVSINYCFTYTPTRPKV